MNHPADTESPKPARDGFYRRRKTGLAAPVFPPPFSAIAALAFATIPGHAIEFEDVSESAGIAQDHHARYNITGQAWGDYNGDGLIDLYLTDSLGPNTLYRNLGDGRFEVSARSPEVSLPDHISGGATFADYDNDGRDDLLVVGLGTPRLLRNTAEGFIDVTQAMGLVHQGQGESAAWGDFDGDGWLDLYIVHFYFDDNESSPLRQDRLYRNLAGQSFAEVSDWLDPARMSGPGFAAAFSDLDHDGDVDLYVVNDKYFGNPLWRNDGPGCGGWCFTDVSVSTGADRPAFSMGVSVGDFDADGDFDLYYSSIGEMILLESGYAQGSESWTDVAAAMSCTFDAVGWGSVFADFDNDAGLDIYLATADSAPGYENRVFSNRFPQPFDDVSETSGGPDGRMTIGVARADYDADGRVDLVIGNMNSGYRLLRNVTQSTGRWLQVELEGGGTINRNAVGTRAVLVLGDGRELHREVRIGESIGAGHGRALHFGLGESVPVRLRIEWSNGDRQIVQNPPLDARLRLRVADAALFADDFEVDQVTVAR
jgi:hypothetical protein